MSEKKGDCGMTRKGKMALLFLAIAAMFCVLGCATQTKELLAENYPRMGDEDLLRYYYRLNDEIERQERPSGPQFGFGLGTFGHHTGVGLGVETGAMGYSADELRKRRIDVLMELRKRGLNP